MGQRSSGIRNLTKKSVLIGKITEKQSPVVPYNRGLAY